jgi:Zn-dependent peptidase ImmA (M78 family)
MCGVALVFVPALPKLRVYGATRWLNNKYVMQLSLYLKSNDQLWFSFFHEVCHIIKHSRRDIFIQGDGLENEVEKEADTFAQNILIPPGQLKHFIGSGYRPDIYDIEQFAKKIGIAPGIVVGRLQHDKVIPMSYGNALKIRCEGMVSQQVS